MTTTILPETIPDRNVEARRKLARLEVYRRAGRIGRTPTRAYVVAVVAWRVGDIPAELRAGGGRLRPGRERGRRLAPDGRHLAG